MRAEACRKMVMMMLVLMLMKRDDRDDRIYKIHGRW